MRTVNVYRGKRRNEVPPHIFAIGDNCYSLMKRTRWVGKRTAENFDL